MGLMEAMDKEAGDVKLGWNPDNKEEVEAAKEQFNKLKKKGFLPYRMYADGKQGEALTEFDKFAEKILFIPPMVGG